jgi:hypothetical protein
MLSFLRIKSKVAESGTLLERTSTRSARMTADLLPQPFAMLIFYASGS